MKNLTPLFSLFAILFLSSCEKETIPKPIENQIIKNSNNPSPALYITGNFNGVDENKIIDGISYRAESDSYLNPQNTYGSWRFILFKTDSSYFPELTFEISNHEESTTLNYSDLVETTNNSLLSFWNVFNSAFQPKSISVIYAPNPNTPNPNEIYFSHGTPPNNTLNVLSTVDTIVNGEQFRLIELSGNINFNSSSGNQISITDLHARIAFSL